MVEKLRSKGLLGVLVALLLALSSVACSGSDETDDPAEEGSATKAPHHVVTLKSSAGEVTGKLPRKTRKRVVAKVSQRVDTWFDAAWLGGDYPRKKMVRAWPGFTKGLTAQARKDRADTTNARLAPRIEGVTPVRKRVQVDILAAQGRAAGATARFRLVFDTTGAVERRVLVQGRFSLTQGKRGWKIFGYDLRRSVGAVPEPGQEKSGQKKSDKKRAEQKKSDGKDSDRKKGEK